MIRLILLAMFVLAFLAIRFLPWWVTLILGVTVILLGKVFAGRLLLWLFSLPFRAKGKVLRGATAEVHRVLPAAAPVLERTALLTSVRSPRENGAGNELDLQAEDANGNDSDYESDEEPDVPRDYYELEVTITPKLATGPFHYWDFTEVSLIQPGKRWDADDDTCRVASVKLVGAPTSIPRPPENNPQAETSDDDGTKVAGPCRLTLLIGVKSGVRELVFNYYFETFGRLQLPAPVKAQT